MGAMQKPTLGQIAKHWQVWLMVVVVSGLISTIGYFVHESTDTNTHRIEELQGVILGLNRQIEDLKRKALQQDSTITSERHFKELIIQQALESRGLISAKIDSAVRGKIEEPTKTLIKK